MLRRISGTSHTCECGDTFSSVSCPDNILQKLISAIGLGFMIFVLHVVNILVGCISPSGRIFPVPGVWYVETKINIMDQNYGTSIMQSKLRGGIFCDTKLSLRHVRTTR